MKDPYLRDNPPAEDPPQDGYKIDPEYVAFEHLYDQAHPDIHLLFRKMRSIADEYEAIAARVLIGEIHEYDWRVWGSYYGWDLSEIHMPYNFILLPTGLDPEGIRRAVEGMEASLPTGAWPNWVIGNHDEPRAATRVGFEESKAAAVLLMTLRGTPTIYYGDEIGMEDVDVPADRRQDPVAHVKPEFGRDGCRTPMRWDSSDTAGFSPQGSTDPWLPTGAQMSADVERQLGEPDSHLELYRRLLEVRRNSPALQLGTISFLSSWEQPNPLVYRRSNGSDEVVVVLNLEPTPSRVTLPGPGTVVAGTHPDLWDTTIDSTVTLRPFEALVVR